MINIPCPSCSCQYCDAETHSGEKVRIEICRCYDSSGKFAVSILPAHDSELQIQKYQCSLEDIEDCLINRLKIDLKSMKHKCRN